MSIRAVPPSAASHSYTERGQYCKQVEQARRTLLKSFKLKGDNQELNQLLHAYHNYISEPETSLAFHQSPIQLLEAFHKLKSSLSSERKDQLSIKINHIEQHLTVSVSGTEIFSMRSTRCKELDPTLFTKLSLDHASLLMAENVKALCLQEDIHKICDSMLSTYGEFLKKSDSDFKEAVEQAVDAFLKLKRRLSKLQGSCVQLKVDIAQRTVDFKVNGANILTFSCHFPCDTPSKALIKVVMKLFLTESPQEHSSDVARLAIAATSDRLRIIDTLYYLNKIFPKLSSTAQRACRIDKRLVPTARLHLGIPPNIIPKHCTAATIEVCGVSFYFADLCGYELSQATELESLILNANIAQEAEYQENLKQLKDIKEWYKQKLKALVNKELDIDALKQLCSDDGELYHAMSRVKKIVPLVSSLTPNEVRTSDEDFKQGLLESLNRLSSKCHNRLNQLITLKQLKNECNAIRTPYTEELDHLVKEMHNMDAEVGQVATSTEDIKHRDTTQLIRPYRQLEAFLLLIQKSPPAFAQSLRLLVKRLPRSNTIEVYIGVRSSRKNIPISKVSVSFADSMEFLNRQRYPLTKLINLGELPKHHHKQHRAISALVKSMNIRIPLAQYAPLDFVQSAEALKWLYQDSEHFISKNVIQCLHFRQKRTQAICFFVAVDGEVSLAMSISPTNDQYRNVEQLLHQEALADKEFDDLQDAKPKLVEHQNAAFKEAERAYCSLTSQTMASETLTPQQHASTIDQLQIHSQFLSQDQGRADDRQRLTPKQTQYANGETKITSKPKSQPSSTYTLDDLTHLNHAQKPAWRLQPKAKEIAESREQMFSRLHSDVTIKQACVIFNALVATNLTAATRANAALRLFEITKLDSNFDFIFKQNDSLQLTYKGKLIAHIPCSVTNWNTAIKPIQIGVTSLITRSSSLGNPSTMIEAFESRLNQDMKSNNIEQLALPTGLTEFNVDARMPEMMLTQSEKSKSTTSSSTLVENLNAYIATLGPKVDLLKEASTPRYKRLMRQCGEAKALLTDSAASQIAAGSRVQDPSNDTQFTIKQLLEICS
ncbi:hypothetical protein JQC92_17295 [Shewanella sp. 202IG2-18]|uniref:hypothetical protein n=1 Tax=Parashewanella hymeniacidonis TaxID=2807618 RepID=UPI001960477A|nr:hypothetical protein [Parashewanella hymeniacidonis]MBM7073768.1 hypothetical protein [Parashewanella hymeniacidonis]